MQTTEKRQKGYKGMAMEGIVARWYTKIRRSGSQIEDWGKQAANLTGGLPDGADVLEVAPGPGYFAIEMARLDRLHVTGLDISHTFVEIARENARQAGVSVDFQQGNASSMPFAEGSFDLIICQAAFKNFSQPGKAIDEMYRVLRGGGMAVIQDMWKEAPDATIRQEVNAMRRTIADELRNEGRLVSRREMLLEAIRTRIGEPPTDVIATVETCPDIAQLDAWFKLALTAKKLASIGIKPQS